jgi:hypothetical protein
MNERPILFSGEMVRAILEGRKTQTRRVIKPQLRINYKCPYGQPGDRLWVRETWQCFKPNTEEIINPNTVNIRALAYRATNEWRGKWRPSIHMPRWASRITLEITAVRVERLQDIGEVDAMREGDPTCENTHIDWFRALWDSINAKRGYSWESNPWVWVVEFQRIREGK